MMMLAIACAGLLGINLPVDSPPPTTDVKQSYEEARAKASRSPDDQVKLALWCEAHGLTTQRLHHLTLAILADPRNAAARGLMGLVSHEGRWLRPEAVAEKAKADPNLAEYEAKRLRTPYTADAQWTLGVWADEHGLKEQAKAHLTAVTRLDPRRDLAWKKLGYKKHEGRWVTEAQLALEKADADAQKTADRKWKPVLEKYRAMLDQPSRKAEAETALAEITDPRAVPMIGQVFAKAEATQSLAVQLLGQIDSAASSKGLAFLSVFAKSAEARRIAAETLRGRDAREYADLLIALIRDPIKFEVKPVGGPGSPGVILVEGKKVIVKRLYSPPSTFQNGDTVKIDPATGLAVVDRVVVFENDRPNVTGHSRYYVSDVGFVSGNASWVSQSPNPFARPATWLSVSNPVTPGAPWQNFVSQVAPKVGQHQAHSLASLHAQALTPAQVYNSAILPGLQANDYAGLVNSIGPDTSIRFDGEALIPLGQVIQESQKTAIAAQEQLESDVRALDSCNRANVMNNDRVVGVLNQATNQNLAADQEVWTKWWVDQIGYAFVTGPEAEKANIVEQVPLKYQSELTPVYQESRIIKFQRVSCFGAGTLVRTVDGSRPIEDLKPGDLVLTQGVASGSLGYKPILVVHHNPPSSTFRIKIDGESIISSHFHRFWVAGRGWVMARDLKAGDPVRTLGGVVPVESVDPDKVQLVYNLDVAEDADFFAGKSGALVHDNTLPDPRLVPFDAEPRAAAGKPVD